MGCPDCSPEAVKRCRGRSLVVYWLSRTTIWLKIGGRSQVMACWYASCGSLTRQLLPFRSNVPLRRRAHAAIGRAPHGRLLLPVPDGARRKRRRGIREWVHGTEVGIYVHIVQFPVRGPASSECGIGSHRER